MDDRSTSSGHVPPATKRPVLTELRHWLSQHTMIGAVAYAYLVVFLFLGIFRLALTRATLVSPEVANPRWALVLAVVFVFPLLLPALKYVAPYVKSIKISEVEVAFAQVEVTSFSLATLAGQLRPPSDQMTAPEYAGVMTSQSGAIVDAIRELQKSKDEVLIVDLGNGKSWIPPNLYFLTILAAQRTSVRQIVFVETRILEGSFVGMCSPERLICVLNRRFPMFQEATLRSNYEQLPLSLDVGQAYFSALRDLYINSGLNPQVSELWLTAAELQNLLGTSLRQETIDSHQLLKEDDYRKILLSDQPYTAVIRACQLESVISRDRVALFIARGFAENAMKMKDSP